MSGLMQMKTLKAPTMRELETKALVAELRTFASRAVHEVGDLLHERSSSPMGLRSADL